MAANVRERVKIYEVMALVAGLALGLWIIAPKEGGGEFGGEGRWLFVAVYILGGLSLIGVPLLLWERRRRKTTWGAGRTLWFSEGIAAWLLWPPIVYGRVRGNRSDTAVCYVYGTPLMAVYVVLALLAGGWFRKRRRKVLFRSWRERFGLALGLAWACIGLYFLSWFYYEDFRR